MKELLNQLDAVNGVKFASFKYRTKGTGELARYVVNIGINLENLYLADIATIDGMLPNLDGLTKDAAEDIRGSLQQTLDNGFGNNDRDTHGKKNGDTYLPTAIAGVFVNKNDGLLHLKNVIVQSKVVIEAGPPEKAKKPVNSSAMTLAKKEIDRNLKRNKLRQFALDGIAVAKLNGEVIELE